MEHYQQEGLKEYLYEYQIEAATDRLIYNLNKHDNSTAEDIINKKIKINSISDINRIYEEQDLPYREKFIPAPNM